MKYAPPLTGDKLRVWLSMPRHDGMILSPAYLEGSAQRTYEKAWGEWLRANHKDWWPDWAEAYIHERKRQRDSEAAGENRATNERGENRNLEKAA